MAIVNLCLRDLKVAVAGVEVCADSSQAPFLNMSCVDTAGFSLGIVNDVAPPLLGWQSWVDDDCNRANRELISMHVEPLSHRAGHRNGFTRVAGMTGR